ncbi:hypothetical protein LCGC14_2701910 [marine sediment metagenome]|uniref:Uncharacterized protein n=1 Tax=marine sediment metagenome TaxID=412755 RepID=A0A0F8ZFK2_9ZZZZ
MANADAAFGFRPIKSDGAPYTGQTERVYFNAAETKAAFIGDVVKISTRAADATGTPAVKIATGGNVAYGVITSFEADPDNLSNQTRVTVTKRFANVVRVDNLEFEVQAATNPGLATVNSNIAYTYAAGSTVTGLSKTEIDTPTTATSGDCQIVRGVNREDNDLTASNAVWVVKFNLVRGEPGAVGV